MLSCCRIAVLWEIWKLIYIHFMVVVVQHSILAFVRDTQSSAKHFFMPSVCLIARLVSIIDIIHQQDEIKSVDISFMHALLLLAFFCRLSMMKSECTQKKLAALLSNVKSILFPGTVFCRHRHRRWYFCCCKLTFFDIFLCVCSFPLCGVSFFDVGYFLRQIA